MGGGLKKNSLSIFIIILITLTVSAMAQNMRNLVPPRAKYLYEYKDIYLSRLRDSLNAEIHSVKPDRNNIHLTVDEIFYKTLRYNVYKYSLTDRFDTLKTLEHVKKEINISPYFNQRVEKWDDESVLRYLTFRIEYEIIIKYFSGFSLEKFKKTSVYRSIVKRLKSESLYENDIDKILENIGTVRFNALHFYYKPHSIEEQLKADKFDIKKYDFDELKSFSEKYSAVLERAEKTYGVNREIITAILRMETNLGKARLAYNPFEVLLGQALFSVENPAESNEQRTNNIKRIDRLKRSAENSLLNIIKYTSENQLDPQSFTSNIVGAMGHTQFMPFNLHLAVDGSGDGKADLSNMEDAIMSIGNFLKHNGWSRFYELDRKNQGEIEKLILRYNTSRTYANSVFEIAFELKRISK